MQKRKITIALFLASTFLFILLFLKAEAQARPVLIVRVPGNQSSEDNRYDYGHAIFRMLLSKTEPEFGPYKLVIAPRMNQRRALDGLKSGELIDAMISNVDSRREEGLLPVRHSIYKNLMGVRLFLVRKSREKEFSKIDSVEALKKFTFGQGADWTDTAILRANGFTVYSGGDYNGLFRMLISDRFDVFPRSVAEIYEELEVHQDKNLVVEGRLGVAYSQPSYILLRKSNKALADRLNRGWAIALKDGSFEKLFTERYGATLQKAALHSRKIFILNNPLNGEPLREDLLIP